MDNQNPEPDQNPDKQNPKRNIGPVLLISSMLLLLLILYGSDTPSRTISEDEFWYRLYSDQIESPEINSPTKISAMLTETGVDGRPVRIAVTLPDTADVKDRVRELNAKELESTIGEKELREKIASEEIQLLKGYPIRLIEPVDPDNLDGETKISYRFFVDWADATGLHYSEIVGANGETNFASLSRTLRDQNATLESGLNFDLAKGLLTEEHNSALLYFFSTFGPILLLIGLFWFLFARQMKGQGQGMMSFGRSRAKLHNKESDTQTTFKDVAGIDEAKEEVEEIIQFLKNPDKFKKLGGRIPRGVLLVGPPGTGKTLLAKAIAGEAEVPFLSISGSDFVEMFVGVGASRVRDLFKQARSSAPCIVFLDEIDAVGRKRGSGMGGGHDEREQTLNAILVEMDGFGTDDGIILMAATNRPDVLDPALLRPGRFDREINIDLPDVAGRAAILAVHATNVTLDPAVDLGEVARGTPGFSGAEIAALVNEAAINAAMADRGSVTQADFEEARDKVRFGREKRSRVLEPEDKRITAYHEAGHAVLNVLLENTEPLHKVTIIPRGMALGSTMMLPEKDRLHLSKKQLEAELAVLYGGRVAEEQFCDDITAGASSDISRATRMAKMMVTEWGMSEVIGPVNFAERSGSEFLGTEFRVGKDHSEETVREIDEEVRRLLTTAQTTARQTIMENKESMERVTEALLMHETISGAEVEQLMEGSVLPVELRPQAPPPPVPTPED
ncbi:MAG: ATP-dependent zinc metalloprotease FtsH [Planctomycetota bacterium]|nr:ATP-dependent zinc metalloprotease FtsH [Planctomycetota bacterium]